MGYNWDNNIYSSPEKHGLEVFAEIHDNEPYQFNMVIVFKHENGDLFWGADSGCSCPSPFEDYNGIEDLEKLNEDTFHDFDASVSARYSGDYCDVSDADISEMVAKVSKYLWDRSKETRRAKGFA